MTDTMINLTPLVEALIAVIALIISTYLIPWLKTKLTAEQLTYAKTAVEVAVYAAEKAYGAGKGEQKLKYVQDVLAARGVELDTIALMSLVDASIKKMEQAETPEIATGELLTAEEDGATGEDEEPQTEV